MSRLAQNIKELSVKSKKKILILVAFLLTLVTSLSSKQSSKRKIAKR